MTRRTYTDLWNFKLRLVPNKAFISPSQLEITNNVKAAKKFILNKILSN